MSDYELLQFAGRHVPDAGSGPFKNIQDAMAAGHDTINPTTGTYELGVVKDGVFVPILEESAGRFANLLEVAKAAQPQSDQPSEQ